MIKWSAAGAGLLALLALLFPAPVQAIETRPEAVLRQGAARIRISIAEVREIRAALINALKKSDIHGGDELAARTAALPAWIDSGGMVMAGGWLLEIRKGRLVATIRVEQTSAAAFGYVASLQQGAGRWRVTRIVAEKTRFRR